MRYKDNIIFSNTKYFGKNFLKNIISSRENADK